MSSQPDTAPTTSWAMCKPSSPLEAFKLPEAEFERVFDACLTPVPKLNPEIHFLLCL